MAQGDGPRRLTRGRDRKVAGVCSGVAEYFDFDPTIVRIVFVVLVLFPFLPVAGGVILYVVLWLIMPEPDDRDDVYRPPARERRARGGGGPSAGVIFGGFLLLLGTLFLFQRAFAFMWPGWWALHIGIFVWPIVLIVIGALIMAAALRGRG